MYDGRQVLWSIDYIVHGFPNKIWSKFSLWLFWDRFWFKDRTGHSDNNNHSDPKVLKIIKVVRLAYFMMSLHGS